MDAAQTPKAIRPAGCMAKLNASRHHLGLCRSVVLSGRYAAPNANADVSSVYRAVRVALASVIDKHPMLRVGIADEVSPNPTYVELHPIDLRDVIEWKAANSEDYTGFLLRSIETQHDRLWKKLDRHRTGHHIDAAPTSVRACLPVISLACALLPREYAHLSAPIYDYRVWSRKHGPLSCHRGRPSFHSANGLGTPRDDIPLYRRERLRARCLKAAVELGANLKTKPTSLPRNDAIALLPWVTDWKKVLAGQGRPAEGWLGVGN